MAIHRDVVWEVRTTGDDTNGGGYKSSAGTTDYSQQDAAELSLTDCATSGTGVTALTSVTGGFTAAMVGSLINLSSGTNLTAGFYEITAFTDANTVTLDRSPDDSVGGVSGATGKVGGALASPAIAANNTNTVNGHKIWVKSGTYPITVASTGVSNGQVYATRGISIEGYGTTRGDRGEKPVLQVGGAVTSGAVLSFVSSSVSSSIINMKVDGSSQAVTGISHTDYRQLTLYCEVVNCANGFTGQADKFSCYAKNCTNGIASGAAAWCYAEDCTKGIDVYTYEATNCVARNCSTGIFVNSGGQCKNCVADRCGTGFQGGWNSFVNAIATNCSTYAFRGTQNTGWYDCSEWNCAGNLLGNPYDDHNFRVLTSDPFIDSANSNYQLNNTAGGGKELRNSFGVPTQVAGDATAVQHELPGGSTGFYYLQTFDNYTGLPQGMGEDTPSMNDFKPLVSSVGNSWTTYAGGFGASHQDHTHRMRLDSADATVYGTGSYRLNLQGFDPGLTSYRITLVALENYSSGAVFKHDPATSTFYMMWLTNGILRLYYFNGVDFNSATYNTSMGVSRSYSMASIEVAGNNVKLYDDSKTLVHTETLTNNTAATGQGLVSTSGADAIVSYYAIHEIGTDFNEIYPPETVGRQPSIPHPLYLS